MSKLQSLKPGSILSETSFFTVKEVKKGEVVVNDEHGNEITVGNEYVDKIMFSADYFSTEEKKTMTELADIFLANPRVAMTVAFYKKDVNKTKTAYTKEVTEAINKVQNAKVADVPGLLKELIENPISKVIPGELRVMKGRHFGEQDEMGRVKFLDMELPMSDASSRLRQVDPRSIQYIIVSGIRYILKK